MNFKTKLFSALTAGLITITALVTPSALAAGPDGGCSGGGPRGGGRMMGTVAEELGLTREELRAELQEEEERSIADVADEYDVEVDDLIDAVVAKAAEHLAEKVADGDLTQDEADARLAEIETKVTEKINSPDTPPVQGKRGPKSND